MDYEKILQELRQHYADLEQHAEQGSTEQSTYHQIGTVSISKGGQEGGKRSLKRSSMW